MYPPDYNPDSSCPYGCDFDCGHFSRGGCSTVAGVETSDYAADPANWPCGDPHDPYDARERSVPFEPSQDPNLWRTKAGCYLPLVDMSTPHLASALGCSVAFDGLMHARSRALLAELTRRSEPLPEGVPASGACMLMETKACAE